MHIGGALLIALWNIFVMSRIKGTLASILAWALGVILYYLLALIPIMFLVTSLIPGLFESIFLGLDLNSAVLSIYQDVWREVIFTTLVSTTMYLLLPEQIRRRAQRVGGLDEPRK